MAITDKFKKGKSLFATTLVSGIGTGTGETITLNSTAGLPTDVEITLTFNRVDGDGVVQPANEMERITGTISGSTLTSYTRATDQSTEQAHSAATVIEYIFNAQDLNDQTDGILVGHGQDGGHNTDAIDAITEIAAAIKTGDDVKLVTGTEGTLNYVSKWNTDGDLVDGFEVLDEDDMNSDSATKLATQQSIKAFTDTFVIAYVIDGGESEITTGVKGDLEVPVDCTIERVTMLADQSGSIVVDIWVEGYADYPPTDADTITASAVPTITTATKSQDSTLTGWTPGLTAGDTIRYNVDSCTTITRAVVSLLVSRT